MDSGSEDLAAMLTRLARHIGDREAPILRARGLSMWEYVILSSLGRSPGLSQSELAERSRRDTTRLIAHLDDLEGRRLITREVDFADRRRRLVRLTDDGAATLAATRAEIRSLEEEVLAGAAGSAEALRVAVEHALSALSPPSDRRPAPD